MRQKFPRVLLAAPKSGSGKTTITCGVLQALMSQGVKCQAWKCGPDYIDPMFHKTVLGVDGGNLDSFFLEEDELRKLFVQSADSNAIGVMEGVMGYYDGIAGISTHASSYDIARITETPVILVVDCKGSSLSVVAMIQGFLEYREDHRIQGVLLNRISPMMAERLKPMIEQLGVLVVGWIPECEEMKLESRHLGLVMPDEKIDFKKNIEHMAEKLCETVNVKLLIKIANSAPELEAEEEVVEDTEVQQESRLRIAVAKGPAFCFYYQENFRLMENMGGDLIPFDPISDEGLPEDVQGIILGGGYPELHASALSANINMRQELKRLIGEGIPYLAECGGFLYLHEELEDNQGNVWPMVGAIKGRAYKTKKLSRFGYITLEKLSYSHATRIKGHEFHYWESSNCGEEWLAKKPLSERSWKCMHDQNNQIAGFPHIYYPSAPEFIRKWLSGCREYGKSQKGTI